MRDYDGPIRQLIITGLGHEEPTLLLANQFHRSPAHLVGRYAQRMIIGAPAAAGHPAGQSEPEAQAQRSRKLLSLY